MNSATKTNTSPTIAVKEQHSTAEGNSTKGLDPFSAALLNAKAGEGANKNYFENTGTYTGKDGEVIDPLEGGYDSPKNTGPSEEDQLIKKHQAALEQGQILFDKEVQERLQIEQQAADAARAELRSIAQHKAIKLKSPTGLASNLMAPPTTRSIENGGSQYRKTYDAGLLTRMEKIIELHRDPSFYKFFNSKNAKKAAAMQLKDDREKPLMTVAGE